MIGRRPRGRGAPPPDDLRARLEQSRLDTLALLRALDQGHVPSRALPQAALAHLAALDADCAEALWALDHPRGTLDIAAMVRDTRTALAALADARAQVRLGLPAAHHPRLQTLEPLIRATLDPREAYNDVPGHDPQNR